MSVYAASDRRYGFSIEPVQRVAQCPARVEAGSFVDQEASRTTMTTPGNNRLETTIVI